MTLLDWTYGATYQQSGYTSAWNWSGSTTAVAADVVGAPGFHAVQSLTLGFRGAQALPVGFRAALALPTGFRSVQEAQE